jgi:hypothetical protein
MKECTLNEILRGELFKNYQILDFINCVGKSVNWNENCKN